MLRLLRQNAGGIDLVMRLNALYGSMVRTSLSVHGRLMRVQAIRQKREAIDGTANADAWALHVAERSMPGVVVPNAGPLKPAWPKAAPVEAPAAGVDQRIAENVSENGINSQFMAFETGLSAQPCNRRSGRSGETGLREGVRKAMAESRSAGQQVQRARTVASCASPDRISVGAICAISHLNLCSRLSCAVRAADPRVELNRFRW